MKKLAFIFFIFLIGLVSISNSANGQYPYEVDIFAFYGQGCSHCGSLLKFLEGIQEDYPNLNIEKHEVYFNEENRELFEQIANAYGISMGGVPTTFINDKSFVGFSQSIGEDIKSEINICSNKQCISPLYKKEQEGSITPQTLTISAVIAAAAVDAINPCAFAVLIILLTTVLTAGKKKKALLSGLAFSSAIFISYFLMGLGLYAAINATGISHTFYTIVAILAIIIGLFNLKDYLWYGKWFKMEVPDSWRPNLQKLIRGITSTPGAFFMGFVVSLFLLPCTSGPYIVILGLLAKAATKYYAILLLLLYNSIFIMPMLIITWAISSGLTTTEKAEAWRRKKLKVLHLIAGIIILLLGIGMLIAMKIGFI